MTEAFNPLAAVTAAVATLPNQAEASKGGGEYVPPAAGLARARFVGYLEVGANENTFEGVTKLANDVQLIFELSGPNHPPRVLPDGTKVPHRMTIFTSAAAGGYSRPLNEKANLFKLFRRMNWEGKATHIAQLLGQAFLVTVVHTVGKDGKVRASLKGDQGFNVNPPRVQDPMTGNTVDIPVDAPISALRLFLWDHASKPMWDSLFIAGTYDAEGDRPARSKNVLQDKIKAAKNFKGSPIEAVLLQGGTPLDLPTAETPARNDVGPGADPLAAF